MGTERKLKTNEIPDLDIMVGRVLVTYALATADKPCWWAGWGWYNAALADCTQAVYDLDSEVTLGRFVQVVAVISPGRYWSKNVSDAKATVRAWLFGKDEEERIEILRNHRVAARFGYDCFRRAWAILDGTATLDESSPKTYAFSDNILNPNTSNRVTIDQHIVHILLDDDEKGSVGVSRAQYPRLVEPIRKTAELLGIQPARLQAILWEYRQRYVMQAR